VLTVGGGAGVIQGVGVPTGRAIVGIGWVMDNAPEKEAEPGKGQGQGQGTADCPFETGCVGVAGGADKDKDGFPDAVDKCPDVPGIIKSGIATGCPDRDKDGVADKYDLCPDEGEDTDGYVDWDGCPDPDNDDDGVPDVSDECDGEPEVMNGVNDTDGCPDEAPDADGDGIPDSMDTKCPRMPEILNGTGDMSDGCPENGLPLVKMNRDTITLLSKLQFADDQPSGEASAKILSALAAGLKNFQEIFLVKVHVTTQEANTGLGARRADAIIKTLTGKGVKARRLYAVGNSGDADDVKLEVLWNSKKPRPPEAGTWPPSPPSDLAAWYAAHPAPASSKAPASAPSARPAPSPPPPPPPSDLPGTRE